MMVVEVFAKVLRAEREKKKLSQEKLAELCDLDRTYISLLERGLRQPTLTTIFRLSRSLGITPSEFIQEVEKKMK
nr:helix-turn-helix transcriptional regulator [uncultured Draconibacterium sp.]